MSQAGVSVVVPVYNNAATLPELCRRVRETVLDRPVELVLVDDGSTDRSRAIVRDLGAQVLRHRTNRGQNAAILSGLAVASQPLACVMDGDLEDPPEAIPLMLAPLDAGLASVVFSSRDEAHPFSSRAFRWYLHRLFPTLPSHACLCFAIDEQARAALIAASRDDDYLPAVIGALGIQATQVDVARGDRPPEAGGSSYGRLKRARYAGRALTASVRAWWRVPPARSFRA